MDDRRTQRIAEAVREEIARLIKYEMTDPRAASVDVVKVTCSRDMGSMHVHCMIPEDAAAGPAMAALRGARSFLRRELAARIRLRKMPDLEFQVDRGPEREARMELLFDRARKWRGKIKDSEAGSSGQ